MTPSRVLVTGGAGQLGSAILQAFEGRVVAAPARSALDITDSQAVAAAVAAASPDVIVNCAAFNDVDGAEARPQEALAANALAVRSLARAAESSGAALVHYSSDFVFDGAAAEPYTEASAPSPRSVYATSKLLGEWFALDAPRAYVLRVESLFGTPRSFAGRRGTLDRIVEGLEAGREVRVFTDRVVSPGHVTDVAAATRHLVDSAAAPGLYHCVNTGHGTWHDVAMVAAEALGVVPHLQPMTMAQVSFPATRPRYCALDTSKLAAAGFSMPSWTSAVRRWIAEREQ
jgi:dTDP-4-dehydrorhamnose reductase